MLLTHHRAILLGAALSLTLTLSACGGREERQQKYLERAEGHLEAGNLDKARVDVKNVLQINPNNADAYYVMALVEEKEQNWRQAFGNLNKASELAPDNLDVKVKLGQFNMMANNLDEARKLADAAFAVAPQNAGVLALLAAVDYRQEKRDSAEKYALDAVKIDPGSEMALAVLAELYQEGRAEEALLLVEQGRTAKPDSVAIRVLKIRTLEALNRPDDVVAEYQLLIATDPENLGYLGKLVEFYQANSRSEEAEALLRARVKALPESTPVKMLLVRFLLTYQGGDVAVAELEQMLKQNPQNMELRAALGSQLAFMGETGRAEAVFKETFEYDVKGSAAQAARNQLTLLALSAKDFEQARRWNGEALDIEPENPEALTNRARMKMIDGDVAEAIPDLRMALRASPESVTTLLLLAEAQQQEGSVNLALDNYRAALKLQPNNLGALYKSAAILAGQQNYQDAEANIEQILAQQPGNVMAINLLAEIYSRQERWDDAQLLVDLLAADEKTAVLSDMMTATLELRQGNYDTAIELSRSALEQNGKLTSAVIVGAQAYATKGDAEGAIAFVQEYLVANPDNGSIYDALAQLYAGSRQFDKAVTAYEKAIELSPESVRSYIGLARVYFTTGAPDAVISLYERGIAANPDNMMLKSELAVRYQVQGDTRKALALLEEANTLDPAALTVRNNLAALLIDHFPTEENLRRAQELTFGFEESGNPALIDTLGWLQYTQGNIPQAINLLVAAQKAGGQGPDYWYHLGMAYYKDGQTELAREQLGKVLADGYEGFYGTAEAQKIYDSL